MSETTIAPARKRAQNRAAAAAKAVVPEELWLDTDVSAYLRGISVRTLANWREARKGPPYIRIGAGQRGGTIYYDPAAVHAWAISNQVDTSAEVA